MGGMVVWWVWVGVWNGRVMGLMGGVVVLWGVGRWVMW